MAGYCAQENNNEICGYDGGDCCECTCEGACEFFACIDPSAPCVDDDDVTIVEVENCGYVSAIGPVNSRAATLENHP